MKNRSFVDKLKIIMFFNLIIIFIITSLFYYLSLKVGVSYESVIIFSCILIVSILLIYFILIKTVFYPISNIDKAIKLLEESNGKNNIRNNIKDEIITIDNLNKMINSFKLSTKREYANTILKKQAELNALQSQINPHFLYNTLESIRGQALIEGVNDIADMTEALAKFFRYSISQRGNIVTLKEELENINIYFKIQKYRFDNRFNLKIIYDKEDNILGFKLPKLTIQPLVENCIYHGLEPKIGQGNITIRIICTNKRLIINVCDDGVGISKVEVNLINKKLRENNFIKENESGDAIIGVALINVNERIKLLYGEEYGINISSTLDVGTEIEIIMPLLNENN